jgi:hypothetical protein
MWVKYRQFLIIHTIYAWSFNVNIMCQGLAVAFLRLVQTYPLHAPDIGSAVQSIVSE